MEQPTNVSQMTVGQVGGNKWMDTYDQHHQHFTNEEIQALKGIGDHFLYEAWVERRLTQCQPQESYLVNSQRY